MHPAGEVAAFSGSINHYVTFEMDYVYSPDDYRRVPFAETSVHHCQRGQNDDCRCYPPIVAEGLLGEKGLDATLADLEAFPPKVLGALHRINTRFFVGAERTSPVDVAITIAGGKYEKTLSHHRLHYHAAFREWVYYDSNSLIRHLPNGWEFTLSNESIFDPNGNNYEAVGYPPDVLVDFNAQGFAIGTDTVLDKTLELIADQASN